MSLLDDARQMDCLCDASEGSHSDACVLVLKPRIIAVLEAAEQVAEAYRHDQATYEPRTLTHGAAERLVAAMEESA